MAPRAAGSSPLPWGVAFTISTRGALVGLLGLMLAFSTLVGVASEPRRLSAAQWTQHRRLPAQPQGTVATSKTAFRRVSAESFAATSSQLQWRASRTLNGRRKTASKTEPREDRRRRAVAEGPRRLAVKPRSTQQRPSSGVVTVQFEDALGPPPEGFEENGRFSSAEWDEETDSASELPQPVPDAGLPIARYAARNRQQVGDDSQAESLPADQTTPNEFDVDSLAGIGVAETDCEKEKYACRLELDELKQKRLADIDLDITLTGMEGRDYPCTCELRDDPFTPRQFALTNFEWKASGLCHKPLYFEQPRVERYGHTVPFVHPAIAAAHFFASVPVLPYKMGLEPPYECVYSLGYYRPGNCAPYLVPPVPLSIRGGLLQAGVVTGLVFAIP